MLKSVNHPRGNGAKTERTEYHNKDILKSKQTYPWFIIRYLIILLSILGYVTLGSMTGGYREYQQQIHFLINTFLEVGDMSNNFNYQFAHYLDGFWACYVLINIMFILGIRKAMRFCLQDGAEAVAKILATAGNSARFGGFQGVYKLGEE